MLILERQILFRNAYHYLLRECFNHKIFTKIEFTQKQIDKRHFYKDIRLVYENTFYCTIGGLEFIYESPFLIKYPDIGIISDDPIIGWIQVGNKKTKKDFFQKHVKDSLIQKMSKLEIVINHLEFLFNQDFYIESIDWDKCKKRDEIIDWVQKDRKVIK